jgi:hypothetical protein
MEIKSQRAWGPPPDGARRRAGICCDAALVWYDIQEETLFALSPIQIPFLQMQVAEPSYPRSLHPSKLREQ